MTNKDLIKYMLDKGEIAHGLIGKNVPITLNDLIEYCKTEGIDFDTPIFLNCPDGYFPLAYYHNGKGHTTDGNEYSLGVLVLEDGEW